MEDWHKLLEAQLVIDEGLRNKPYKDTVGKLTIGVGRNLDDVGLRDDEVMYLLHNDMAVAEITARKLVKNFDELSDNRKAVVTNMAFNLGQDRLSKFVNTLKAINEGRWEDACEGMANSAWYKQVGNRAKRLVELMRKG